MIRLLSLLVSWSVRRILLFVLIVAAMAAFVKVVDAYTRLPALAGEIESLERHERLLAEEIERQRSEAQAALAQIDRLEGPMLRERLASVRAQIAEVESGRASGVGLALQAARGEGSALAREAAARFRLHLLRSEQALIVARLHALARQGQVRGIAGRVAVIDARLGQLDGQIAAIEREHPLLSRIEKVPLVRRLQGPWNVLRAARREAAALRGERARLAAAQQGAAAAFVRARSSYHGARSALRDAEGPTATLRDSIASKQALLEGHWASRIWQAVRPVLSWALWVMLLIVVTPPAIKAFWFFLVAPYAARLRPVRIGATGASEIGWAEDRREDGDGGGSAVSWRLRLRAGEEALLRPEYLQSSPAEARAGSQLLLSRALPLGSLATGLYALTRIRADRELSITVSATADLVDEVGLIEVPEGAAIVFRPRGLVGIVQPADRPLRLERVWTLDRLASWLTLRLRHLVFHGPCALIVKGARGVAIEPAGAGRRVAGAATMGWSSGLDHRVARSETFIAFLAGKQSLFNDRFDGPRGKVVYEELPRAGAQSGLFGRGLEGLGEAMLKIVGL